MNVSWAYTQFAPLDDERNQVVLVITVKITKSLLRFNKERANWKTASCMGCTGGSCALQREERFAGHLTNTWNERLVYSIAWMDGWQANPLGTCKPQISLGMPDLAMHFSHGDTLTTEKRIYPDRGYPVSGEEVKRRARPWLQDMLYSGSHPLVQAWKWSQMHNTKSIVVCLNNLMLWLSVGMYQCV